MPPFGVTDPGRKNDQPGAEAWPVTAAAWILLHQRPEDVAAAASALKFFAWAYANRGQMVEELDYSPMPAGVGADIRKMWAAEIRGPDGQSLLRN
jgi:phosphate transport system substrate-binding protein